MDNQLVLLEDHDDGSAEAPRADWGLDEHTREVGRRGVALARQALRQASLRAA
jgi:hypothetical protein